MSIKSKELTNRLNKLPVYEDDYTNIPKLNDKDRKSYNEKMLLLNEFKEVEKPKYSSSIIKEILNIKNNLKNYEDITNEEIIEDIEENLEKHYEIAKKIKIVDKPVYDSKYIEKVINDTNEYEKLLTLIESLKSNIKEEYKSDKTLEYLNEIKNNIIDNDKIIFNIKTNTNKINNTKTKIDNIKIDEDLDEDINSIKDEIHDLKYDIKLRINSNKYMELYDEYVYNREQLEIEKNNMFYCETLKNKLKKCEKESLDNILTTINLTINEIIPKLFKEKIAVEFSFKTSKDGKEKDGLDIKVYHKGSERKKLSVLSGGEKSRFHIAFTLALTLMQNSTIVLLDEILKGLDPDNIELCMKVINEITPDTTKICINHNDSDHNYDHIINIE